MPKHRSLLTRAALLISLLVSLTVISTRLQADTGMCGGANITLPFTDVPGSSIFFCSIASAYFTGLTNGTTATTYSPDLNVTRDQMAAFTTRTLDQSIRRAHTRAALGEWWTNQSASGRLSTVLGGHNPRFLASDGHSVWVATTDSNSVSRVDIQSGSPICTLSGVATPGQIIIVSGNVYVASMQAPGKIYQASFQSTVSGPMSEFAANLGNNPQGITFDGLNLWTANTGTAPGNGSISKVNLQTGIPSTFTTGFSQPVGILFDGTSLWVTDQGNTSLKRVDTANGAVLQTIALGGTVGHPVFDGINLWIPCAGPDQIFVVRGSGVLAGTVLAQLTGNGLNGPALAAFDGERICVTNAGGLTVSLWKASDLTPITTFGVAPSTDINPRGVCSDGTTFFVGLRIAAGGSSQVIRL